MHPVSARASVAHEGISKPEQRVLDAIAWFKAIGIETPSKVAVAFIAGYRSTSGGYANLCRMLRSKSLVTYPEGSLIALTLDGETKADAPEITASTNEELHQIILHKLSTPEGKVLAPILEAYPSDIARDEIAVAAGYEPTSGGFANLLGVLRTMGMIDYPTPGRVKAQDILFPMDHA